MIITREGNTPLSNTIVYIDGKRLNVSTCDIHFENGVLKITVYTKKENIVTKVPAFLKDKEIYTSQANLMKGIVISSEKKIFPLKDDTTLQLNLKRKKMGVKTVEGRPTPVDLVSSEYDIQNIRCMEQAVEDLVKQEREIGTITLDKPPVAVFEKVDSNYFVLFERVYK